MEKKRLWVPSVKRVHCLGIGGIGVSAVAELLCRRGMRISGSDMAEGANTRRLQALGISVRIGHSEEVPVVDAAIYSSAVSASNPEFAALVRQGVPLWRRGDVLADLMRDYQAIAVAGTHGKTTTSGLLSHTLRVAGMDPSFALGGICRGMDSPAYLGKGPVFVAEADESDGSFLAMSPWGAIITNIDSDHLETYAGSFERLQAAFQQFVAGLSVDGCLVVCADDPVLQTLRTQFTGACSYTYGFSEAADYHIVESCAMGLSMRFVVRSPDGRMRELTLGIPGRHNVLNATGVLAICDQLNVPDDKIREAFRSFAGMGRRFEQKGWMQLPAGGQLRVLEDYGHHPTEIRATLSAVREAFPGIPVGFVFQPHRYTRTRDLMSEFSKVLAEADTLVLLDIYSAGETPLEGVNSAILWNTIGFSEKQGCYLSDTATLRPVLQQLWDTQPAGVVIFQGAGSVGCLANKIVDQFPPL